jgi:hypothetical protein
MDEEYMDQYEMDIEDAPDKEKLDAVINKLIKTEGSFTA